MEASLETLDLTPIQERAAVLLAGGHSARDVARQLDVTEQTIGRWRKLPAFIAALAAAGEAFDADARVEMAAFSNEPRQGKQEALTSLRGHLKSDNAVYALRAAEILLKA
jgi:transposase-like protein